MATPGIAGKLLRVKFGDKYIKCQADCSVNFTNTYDEESGCKPADAVQVSEGVWVDRSEIDQQDWSVNVSSRMFADDLADAEVTQGDIITANIDGDVNAEIEILTTPGQHTLANDIIITGNVVIGNIDLNAPLQGKATVDYTFPGNGKPSYDHIPVATGG